MIAGKEKGIDSGRRSMRTGTTSTTKTMITNIPHCITEVVEAETGRETECPHYLEITPLKGEEEEGEKSEVLPLTILHHLRQQGPSPALKSRRQRR